MQHASKNLFFIFGVTLLIFIVAVTHSVDKPMTADEAMPFAWNARVINQAGVSALGQRVAEGSNETVLEIAHPPLYNLILALSFTLFGETAASGRMIGVLCLILTAGVLLKIAPEVFGEKRARSIGLLAAGMMAINPYVVQHALLLEIDTSILTLFLTATIYFFIRLLRTNASRYLVLTGVVLGAAFWAKEMTPPILIIAIFIFLWLYRGLRAAVFQTGIITAIGLGLFVLTWWAFCALTNVPLMSFVEFTILRKGATAAPFSYPFAPLLAMKSMLFWLSPPLFILFFIYSAVRIKAGFACKRLELQDFLLIYAGLVLCYAMLYIPSATGNLLLKYEFPAVPILILATAVLVDDLLPRLTGWGVTVIFTAALATLGFYQLCRLEDPLLLLYSGELRFRSPASLVFFAPLLIFFILTQLFWLRQKAAPSAVMPAKAEMHTSQKFVDARLHEHDKIKQSLTGIFQPSPPWLRALACAAGLSLLPMNAHVTFKQTADYTTPLSWDNYGEKGFAQTVAYLAARLEPEDKIIVRKDLGYALNGLSGLEKVQWFYPVFRGTSEEMRREFEAIQAAHALSFIVLDQYSNPEVASELIRPFFEFDRTIGDFHVYRRKK